MFLAPGSLGIGRRRAGPVAVPGWVPAGAVYAFEPLVNRQWLNGALGDNLSAGFAASTVRNFWSGGYALGTIEQAAIDAPAVAANGLLLRPSREQLVGSPANVGGWSVSNSATRSATGTGFSGIVGHLIASGGSISGRYFGTIAALTSGLQYSCAWLYKAGSSPTCRLHVSAAGNVSYLTGAPGSLIVGSAAGGTLTDIAEHDMGAGVRLATARFSPGFTGTGNVGLGPGTATAGLDIMAFGANLWSTGERQEFSKSQHVRGAETLSPALPAGTYDFEIIGPDDLSDLRYSIAWTPGDTIAPNAGQDRIKAVYAIPTPAGRGFFGPEFGEEFE